MPICTDCMGTSFTKQSNGFLLCDTCGLETRDLSQVVDDFTFGIRKRPTLLSAVELELLRSSMPSVDQTSAGSSSTAASELGETPVTSSSRRLASKYQAFNLVLIAQAKALVDHFEFDARVEGVVAEIWLQYLGRCGFSGLVFETVVCARKAEKKAAKKVKETLKEQRFKTAWAAQLAEVRASQMADEALSQRLGEEDDGSLAQQQQLYERLLLAGDELQQLKLAAEKARALIKERKQALWLNDDCKTKNEVLYFFRQDGPPLELSLAVCYAALVHIRAPVLAGDLVNWALAGRLPYLRPWTQLDSSHFSEHERELVRCEFGHRDAYVVPNSARIAGFVGQLSRRTGLTLPPPNLRGLALRLLHEFGLPAAQLLDPLLNIFALGRFPTESSDDMRFKNDPSVTCEAGILASLVVLVKMTYKLDEVDSPPHIPPQAARLPSAAALVVHWESLLRRFTALPLSPGQLDDALIDSPEPDDAADAAANSRLPLYAYLRFCAQHIYPKDKDRRSHPAKCFAELARIDLDDRTPYTDPLPPPATAKYRPTDSFCYTPFVKLAFSKFFSYPLRLLVEVAAHFLVWSPLYFFRLVRKIERVLFRTHYTKPVPASPHTITKIRATLSKIGKLKAPPQVSATTPKPPRTPRKPRTPSSKTPAPRTPSSKIPTLRSSKIPTPTLPSTRIPTPTLPSTRIPTPTLPSTRIPTPTLPSTRIPTPTLPSTRIPTPTLPSTRIPTPTLSSTRMATPTTRPRMPILPVTPTDKKNEKDNAYGK